MILGHKFQSERSRFTDLRGLRTIIHKTTKILLTNAGGYVPDYAKDRRTGHFCFNT